MVIIYRPIEIDDHPVILASFFGKDGMLLSNQNNGMPQRGADNINTFFNLTLLLAGPPFGGPVSFWTYRKLANRN